MLASATSQSASVAGSAVSRMRRNWRADSRRSRLPAVQVHRAGGGGGARELHQPTVVSRIEDDPTRRRVGTSCSSVANSRAGSTARPTPARSAGLREASSAPMTCGVFRPICS